MILGNIDQLSFNPYRSLGHFSVQNNLRPSSWHLSHFPDTSDTATITAMKKACFPTGTQPPYSWLLAPKGGEMSSTTAISGSGSITSGMASGKALEATMDGVGTISDASMALVTSMIAILSGSGTLSGSMVGTIQMASDLAGSGDLTASAKLIAGIIGELSGSGTLTSDLKGKLAMEADIYVNESTATVNQIVSAVWSALAADFNESGTMGEKLNGAGNAGDPWTTDLSGYTTNGTAGKIVKQIKAIASAGL